MKNLNFQFIKTLNQLLISKLSLAVFLVLFVITFANAQPSDTTAPELVELSMTPAAIDTTTSTLDVTVTIRAKDLGAGIRYVSVDFWRTGDDYMFPILMDSRHRISGDEKDGVYRDVYRFLNTTPSGMYNLLVSVLDNSGNKKYYFQADLAALGFPSQLQVNKPLQEFVSVSGRVRDLNHRGVSKALVTLTESNGNVKYAVTNPFGYYRFERVKNWEVIKVEVKHKRLNFMTYNLFLPYEISYVDFFANPPR